MTVVASGYERQKNELYETEPWATDALLRHFPVRGRTVWEPAAGRHKIARVLRDQGATVTTSDIATYDVEHDAIFDFLDPTIDAGYYRDTSIDIYTNPPYGPGNRDAVRFARMALKRSAGTVALLLTAKFDFGNTRHDLFRDNDRFTAKINLVDRVQWFPGDSSGTEDHAWYVWTARRQTAAPVILYAGRADCRHYDLFGPVNKVNP